MKAIRITARLTPLIALVLFAASCADKARTDLNKQDRESFDGWMAKYAPGATPVDQIYMEFVERGALDNSAPVLEHCYVRLNYTGRTFDQTIFVTRNQEISTLLGRFAYSTHYADDYAQFSANNKKFCEGFRFALEHMREGDSARIYIPSNMGYGSGSEFPGGGYAYTGQQKPGGGTMPGPAYSYLIRPIILDVRLKKVDYDPFVAERHRVEEYAKTNWNMTKADTLGLFIRIIKENPAGDPLKDSSAYMYFQQYFPEDNFLITTNVDSIAREHHVYTSNEEENSYTPILVTSIDGEANIAHKAYFFAKERMRKGETAEVISISNWAYGSSGAVSNKPEVLPYQAVKYIIYAMTDKEVADRDDAAGVQ